jgi:cytosine/adenosine deaminase-related metal-dependent hydrolase
MRFLSADYIFPIASVPIKGGIVGIASDGTITAVLQPLSSEAKAINQSTIEHFSGIICPAFVNTHCHLELSHLKAAIPPNQGMMGFIKAIVQTRSNYTLAQITEHITLALQELHNNGVVAIGDISNDESTVEAKQKSPLRFYTFLEVFDFDENKAEQLFQAAKQIQQLFIQNQNTASIVPHAPYSVSKKLFGLINEYAFQSNSVVSIHNQESKAEEELFTSQSGAMAEGFSKMDVPIKDLAISNKNSLQSFLPLLNKAKKILLVHNTYTNQNDIEFIQQQITNYKQRVVFCTCPNANLYIENKLPDYHLLLNSGCCVTVGTDSLASNWSLSVLDELKTISKHFPEINLQTLLTWATKNGADFLGFDEFGTLEVGKKPGLLLLENTNNITITASTKVKRIA